MIKNSAVVIALELKQRKKKTTYWEEEAIVMDNSWNYGYRLKSIEPQNKKSATQTCAQFITVVWNPTKDLFFWIFCMGSDLRQKRYILIY